MKRFIHTQLQAEDRVLKRWLPAAIVEVDEISRHIKLRFAGFPPAWDEWISLRTDNHRIRAHSLPPL